MPLGPTCQHRFPVCHPSNLCGHSISGSFCAYSPLFQGGLLTHSVLRSSSRSGVADLILLLLSALILVVVDVCFKDREPGFAWVWVWSSVVIVTLLVQVIITASDLVLAQIEPDAVYPNALAYSLMYVACQSCYFVGVLSFVYTAPKKPARESPSMAYAQHEVDTPPFTINDGS